ncbi:hypothetical protein [Kribbella italica]|uniref:Uncharacterized protein n=1 Tax=Kribbella italica TaxID=1540520 RepID=A0A7W9JDN6_9ACTN|nr:hypothetical protein [Kribbella italica]MBB5840203.1 hypothetical protein [Kribbella italica]
MEITEEMLLSIPPGNVRVPVEEFAVVWRLAESECLRLVRATSVGESSRELSYASAVMGTLRWLAAAQAPFGPPGSGMSREASAPFTPYTGRALGRADHDSIREARDSVRAMLLMFPDGYKTAGMPPRPGYLEGVADAIEWAWVFGPAPRLAQLPADSPRTA